ncbi:hypothetical protein K2173_024064 [Erythroxylum novogranatense]|uniref:Magnesium transporter n=1 Tax=Erythroxylum novogranatense TaxID=1862640 RepID=A0AAV8TTH5_9ROSI|nr:hypothetical protein K2173_024064 [Erythroxylum novogranatense]
MINRAVTFSVRQKGTGVRAWLLLDSSGLSQVLEEGKYATMRRTGLPARDLRILDPLLSYPSTVLGRERAIVIKLEHIKAIITAHEVLLLNSKDPSVVSFVEELRRRLTSRYEATKIPDETPPMEVTRSQSFRGGSTRSLQGPEKRDVSSKVLPFEFVALEACLEAACSSLEIEAMALEEEAYPTLDKLTSKISTHNLERVRQIKNRLVDISGRVQKVRDELEHLLDDDGDMAEMYLTEKLFQQQLEDSSNSSLNEGDDINDTDLHTIFEDQIHAEDLLQVQGTSTRYEINVADRSEDNMSNKHIRDSHGTKTSCSHSVIGKHLNVEELEMLLETYFVQVDGVLNKLSTLREYVDDTDDYVNIMLDDKQNQLLRMGVLMTTANLVLTAFIVLCGVMGVNIRIELFKESVETGMPKFLWTVGGGTAGTIFLYVMAIAWYKHKRLI